MDRVSRKRIWTTAMQRYFGAQFWQKIWMTWNETSAALKTAWIVLWGFGLVLLTLGIWGDRAGFWASKPFLTNTFSALTGAAFGIPLALVVLQRVVASEADAAETRAAQRMAVRVSADLAWVVGELIEGGLSKAQAAEAFLKDRRSKLPGKGHIGVNFKAELQLYMDTNKEIYRYIRDLWSKETAHVQAELSTQWSILNTEVRFRLLGTGGDWLPGMDVQVINRYVARVTEFDSAMWLYRSTTIQDGFHSFAEQERTFTISDVSAISEIANQFDNWLEEILYFISNVEVLIRAIAIATQDLTKSVG
jgi:hypothetical protein